MFSTFQFIGYSRKISNYPERTTLSDSTHMMRIVDFVVNGVWTLRIDGEYFIQKEFTLKICINP